MTHRHVLPRSLPLSGMLVALLIASAFLGPERPLSAAAGAVAAQAPAQARGAAPGPVVISPEVGADRRVTVRVLAADGPIVRIGIGPARMPIRLPRIGYGVHHYTALGTRSPCYEFLFAGID